MNAAKKESGHLHYFFTLRYIGLPIDIKAMILFSKKISFTSGINGFAFFTFHNKYFGICLNLGFFLSGPRIPSNAFSPR
jgi:hypothetical protein